MMAMLSFALFDYKKVNSIESIAEMRCFFELCL